MAPSEPVPGPGEEDEGGYRVFTVLTRCWERKCWEKESRSLLVPGLPGMGVWPMPEGE